MNDTPVPLGAPHCPPCTLSGVLPTVQPGVDGASSRGWGGLGFRVEGLPPMPRGLVPEVRPALATCPAAHTLLPTLPLCRCGS